jgi:hypothetical protein
MHSVQTHCEDNPAFYPMDTGGFSPGGKAAESWI